MVQINKVTEWVRSKPIDKKKEIFGEIDSNNIVKGTRRRNDFNYNAFEALAPNKIENAHRFRPRKSHNVLEQRMKKLF
jgi:hypothetical protein